MLENYPVLLYELNENAVASIYRENYEQAMGYLVRAHDVLNAICFGDYSRNTSIALVTLHNLALCSQRLGMANECLEALRGSFEIVRFLMSTSKEPSSIRSFVYLSKLHMQICALLSQQEHHKEALEHAKYSVKYSHAALNRTIQLAETLITKPCGSSESFFVRLKQYHRGLSGNSPGDEVAKPRTNEPPSAPPVVEFMAVKVLPILYELRIRIDGDLLEHKEKNAGQYQTGLNWRKHKAQPAAKRLSMKNLFGYCQMNEWCDNVSMSSIMQISPLTLHDLPLLSTSEVELSRESLIEKITLILISYFCVGTEKRFVSAGDEERKKQWEEQSEYWHTKVLELACGFLPPNCPLLAHIFSSHQKNHSLLQTPIVLFLGYIG